MSSVLTFSRDWTFRLVRVIRMRWLFYRVVLAFVSSILFFIAIVGRWSVGVFFQRTGCSPCSFSILWEDIVIDFIDRQDSASRDAAVT